MQKVSNQNKVWREKDDALLFNLKSKGTKSSTIAEVLGRTTSAIDARYWFLRKEREVKRPFVETNDVEWEEEEEVKNISFAWTPQGTEVPQEIMIVTVGGHTWEVLPGMTIRHEEWSVSYKPSV